MGGSPSNNEALCRGQHATRPRLSRTVTGPPTLSRFGAAGRQQKPAPGAVHSGASAVRLAERFLSKNAQSSRPPM